MWHEFAALFDRAREVDWTQAGFLPAGPVAEVGSGDGSNLVPLLAALPEMSVWAIEPDPTARALLVQRLSAHELTDRVTIVASGIEDAELPRLGGVVATGVFYFLSPQVRAATWRHLASVLEPGAPVVVEVADANDPSQPEPERLVRTATMGEFTYERWFAGRPLGDGRVELVNTARVRHGERLLREVPCTFTTWVLPHEEKCAEALATGLFEEHPFPGTDAYTRLVRR